MRLGLVGPAGSEVGRLRAVAEFFVELQADRVIYLGSDAAFDRQIAAWGQEIVGGEPTQEALWLRAAERCSTASAAEIDAFVGAERKLERLLVFESLPFDGARSVELLDGKIAIIIFDKADLDEEDMLPATLLVYGKGSAPLIKRVGQRWFVCPGSLETSGLMLLDDEDDGITLKLFDNECKLTHSEKLAAPRAVKMQVSGG